MLDCFSRSLFFVCAGGRTQGPAHIRQAPPPTLEPLTLNKGVLCCFGFRDRFLCGFGACLSWHLLCRPGWPELTVLGLNKGLHHHFPPSTISLKFTDSVGGPVGGRREKVVIIWSGDPMACCLLTRKMFIWLDLVRIMGNSSCSDVKTTMARSCPEESVL